MTCVACFFILHCCELSMKFWAQQYINCCGWWEFMFLMPSKWITLQHSCGPHILKSAVLTFLNMQSHIPKYVVPAFQNLQSSHYKIYSPTFWNLWSNIPKSVVPTFQILRSPHSEICGPTFRNLRSHIPKPAAPTFQNLRSPHSEIYEFRHHVTIWSPSLGILCNMADFRQTKMLPLTSSQT